MIPSEMKAFLEERLPGGILKNRVVREAGRVYLELHHRDEQLLNVLGLTADKLGPYLLVCLWDEQSDLEVGGYLVVDNLSMGSPSMGGIRMLPGITPLDIHNLARGMTLKNGAADLPYGGGKSGVVAPQHPLSPEVHTEIVRRFARLIRRYRGIYVPGPDVGTDDRDMKTIAVENGLDSAVSKTADMGGNRIDELGGAAGGVIIALATLLEIMPRLKVLPQFNDLEVPVGEELTVLFQGFGAVGAHAARIMLERLPGARTIGVSDMDGCLYDPQGLPIEALFQKWEKEKLVTKSYYQGHISSLGRNASTQFSTNANNLLRESAFCLVPATSVFHYLGVDPEERASMTVERMGVWRLIVEGANTYSPDPNRRALRTRMEQVVYREKGVLIATDYLVNSGGVIFAAQEHYIPTPVNLQVPEDRLGDSKAVEHWLKRHADAFAELSARRREAGEDWREKVIRTNMKELVDFLAADANLLPNKAAERISLRRLTAREKERTARELMIPIAMVSREAPVQEAAEKIVSIKSNLAAVVDENGKLTGVITAWDITRALAENPACGGLQVAQVMTTPVQSVSLDCTIPRILKKLEENRISAVPVVEEGAVLGLVNSDILAYRFLQQYTP